MTGDDWTNTKNKARIKRALIRRDGERCGICGYRMDAALTFPHPGAATIDHIKRLRDGGGNELANLRLTHSRCNFERS